jgi:3-oxoacyl-[acyl-carrier protein] reductase
LVGNRDQVNYRVAKAGINGAIKALALEMGKRKITVNCAAPGIIETKIVEMIPLRRIGQAEDLSGTVNIFNVW